MTEVRTHPFIDRLQELANNQERGALAALRRGLGQPPGTTPEMYRYVEPFLAQNRSLEQERPYYLPDGIALCTASSFYQFWQHGNTFTCLWANRRA